MESAKKSHLADVRAALANNDVRGVHGTVNALHPADIALLLESLPVPERDAVWPLIDDDIEGEILVELNDEVRQGLLETMDVAAVVAAMRDMELDDLADVVADLPATMSERVIAALPAQDRERLRSVLAYDEDSAGGIMDPDVISVRSDVTLEVVMRYLRRAGEMPDGTPAVLIVDRDHRFVGMLYLTRLVTQDPEARVADVMDATAQPIPAHWSAGSVAQEFKSHDLLLAAVVDDDGRLIGQITADDVMSVIQEQADHDFLGMAGLDEEDDIFAPIVTSARRRAIWLGINLATAFLAAAVVALFKPALEKIVILAVLMPVVASMGGIAGSQTLTLMIRGMALGRVQDSNARWLLIKEVSVGLLNGLGWAIIVAFVTLLFFGTWQVAFIIAAALIVSLLAAALAGFSIPLLLRRLRIDPALAGTVILTTVTDVVGFAAFLGLATLYLL